MGHCVLDGGRKGDTIEKKPEPRNFAHLHKTCHDRRRNRGMPDHSAGAIKGIERKTT